MACTSVQRANVCKQNSCLVRGKNRCVFGLVGCLLRLQETQWSRFMVFFSAAGVSSAWTRKRPRIRSFWMVFVCLEFFL